MVRASQCFVSGIWVPALLPRPFKERLVLNIEHDLVNGFIENGINTFKAVGANNAVVLPSFAFALIELSAVSAGPNIVHLCLSWSCLLLGHLVVLNPCIFIYPREQLIECSRRLSGKDVIDPVLIL